MSLAFLFQLFNAKHVSDINIIHPQELATYLLSYFMGCIALVRCVLVLRCGSAGVVWRLQPASCIPAKPQRNTNTHRTRAIRPFFS